MFPNKNEIQRALVSLAIERALLKMGKDVFDKVTNVLMSRYNCYIHDCYDHPEYLSSIVKESFENLYHTILKSIEEELGEFVREEPISQFLDEMKGKTKT